MPISDNAATFLGINNENEFYSAHYLAEVFNGDIKNILADWKEKETTEEQFRAPNSRLRAMANDYFLMRERSQKERNAKKAIAMQRDFFKQFCSVLDIPWAPQNLRVTTDKKNLDTELPVLSILPNTDKPALMVIGALDGNKEGTDPLLLELSKEQFIGDGPQADSLAGTTWYELLNDVIFKQDQPPRWVLLLSDRQCLLIDRYKWLQNRLLRFDLDEILGRKDDVTLKATAALLHRDSLAPENGNSLLDSLDENSHKHAFGVSEDLKYALREAIELLGNEASEQLIQRNEISFTGKSALDAEALSRECLRYMYRLLFLFYIEARPELKYVPSDSPAYRKGYSLETLRDLELVKLTTEESRKGSYLHQSLSLLFKLIHTGYSGKRDDQLSDSWKSKGNDSFSLEKLDSHLFDPKQTPYLNKVTFSNQTLKAIIELMSLTREKPGRSRKRRGRVSYAQLGINQLGAVYEALLSYRGFFAAHDLYEVKKAGDKYNELDTGYFVPAAEIEQYHEDEKVYTKDDNGLKALKRHAKGKFIYRLAGRDREKSASYYTPEVLTNCVVKYTLKERLKGLKADDILKLSMCEPAMGSAAFLNESINQLSEAYLTLKQQELGIRIPHEDYREALQKVKMYIADHNVYGVDLNPIATELAEISLWLNALSKSSTVPWFGYQLFNGNSLIGARRQVYDSSLLTIKTKTGKWHNYEPKRLDPQDPKREAKEIYHFLVPDPGMVGVNDKEAKKLKPDAFEAIKKWKTPFLKPLDADEITLLQQLSSAIDELWKEHTDMLRTHRKQTEDEFPIWGQETKTYHTTTAQKDQIRSSGIFNNNAKIASPYRRLKLAMDYWCALWFWPIDQVDLLPERSDWLFELNLILRGQVFSFQVAEPELNFEAAPAAELLPSVGQQALFETDHQQLTLTTQEQKAQSVKTAKGEINLEKLLTQFPRLKLVDKLAKQYKFFHWELTFSDVFKDKGGFDIILGNPPWLKVEWNEGGILGDYNPQFILKKLSATKLREERKKAFERNTKLENDWFDELVDAEGTLSFLKSIQNYPELIGVRTNLYKCFLPLAWNISNNNGTQGFIHPEGVYDDMRGLELRKKIYEKIRYHFQFRNEKKLFPIQNTRTYSLNIYGSTGEIGFDSISNLFHPSTISESYNDTDGLIVQGVRNAKNQWNTGGSKRRIIRVDMTTLKVFSEIYTQSELSPDVSILPALHDYSFVDILYKIVSSGVPFKKISEEYSTDGMWNETTAKDDNTIQRYTDYPSNEDNIILSGPHIYVANPCSASAQKPCTSAKAYDYVDHLDVNPDYNVRTNYKTVCSDNEFLRRQPRVSWLETGKSEPKRLSEYFRIAYRGMLDAGMERTLIAAIIPKKTTHINGLRSYAFKDTNTLLTIAGHHQSLIYDFLIKSTNKQNLQRNLELFKIVKLEGSIRSSVFNRVLFLNCWQVTYEDVWENNFTENDNWTCSVTLPCLCKKTPSFSDLKNKSIRSEYLRRLALIELDVLIAISLGLHLSELISLYQVQFWVLRQNENDTYYDTNGRVVFTISAGLAGVGFPRKAKKDEAQVLIEYPDGRTETKPLGWEDICPEPAPATADGRRENYASGQSYGKPKIPDGTKIHRTVIDDTLPGGPREKVITYVAPFYLPDREEDYRVAWDVFSKRFAAEDPANEKLPQAVAELTEDRPPLILQQAVGDSKSPHKDKA